MVALVAVIGLVACGKPQPSPKAVIPGDTTPVVATVGPTAITYRMLQRIAAQNGYDLADSKQADLALRDAVNFEILAAEALARGYDKDPEIVSYVRTQAVQKLLRDTVDAKNQPAKPPADDQLRAYFEAHKNEFTPPTMARAQILSLLKRQGQEAAFAQKLDAVKAAIASKELPFGELVKQFSDDPAARTYAGMTNWLVKGEESKLYPASVLEAVFSAKDTAGITGPLEHNDWVYFVRVHERRDPQATAFDQARPRIALQLERTARLEAYDAFVGTLRKDIKAETFPDKVREAATASHKPSDGPPMGPVPLPVK